MRRPVLTALVIAVLATAPIAAPNREAKRSADVVFDRTAAKHLLTRAGFGGTAEDVDRLVALGLERAVAHLMDGTPESVTALPAFEPTVTRAPNREDLRGLSAEERQKVAQEHRRRDQQQMQAYRAWWIERMATTPAPLREKMVLFWHGHFTSSHRDVRSSYHLVLQNELFRRFALGDFAELLRLVSRDPAMIRYLDTNRNRKGQPNENYAREVMELFTLGAGSYTEKDIKEAARAFTGFNYAGNEFRFVRNAHDDGEKTILGRTGRFDGDDVCRILVEQDAAPRHLASKLIDFFVGPNAPKGMLERYARLLRKNEWHLRPVLTALFTDPDFYRDEVIGSKILGPVDFVVSISRRLGETPPGRLLASYAGLLGQELFGPPNVKGWEGEDAWITTATFLERGNFAAYLIEGVDRRRIMTDYLGDVGGGERLPRRGRPNRRDRDRGGDDEDDGDDSGENEGGGDEMSPAERMRSAARSMGRQLRGMAAGGEWKPATRIASLPGVKEAASAAELVDALCARFLAVTVTPEARESLITFAGAGDEAYRLPSEHKLKRLVHLILSLPEAQLG